MFASGKFNFMLRYFMLSQRKTSGFQTENHVTLQRAVKKKDSQWFWWLQACEGKKGKYHGTAHEWSIWW